MDTESNTYALWHVTRELLELGVEVDLDEKPNTDWWDGYGILNLYNSSALHFYSLG
jgi:hypothetical protein